MLRHPDYTRVRLHQLAQRMQQKIYPQHIAVQELMVSPQVDRISYAVAQQLTYRPVQRGEQFGPLWATYWFKAKAVVPDDWSGRVDLLWISHSEATLWRDGRSLQGLNYEPSSHDRSARSDAVLLDSAKGGETVEFEIEMACNKVFGSTSSPFKTVSPFVLDQCDIALFDSAAWELYFDFMVLQKLEVEGEKDLDKTWAGELLAVLNHFANTYNPDDRTTWKAAHAILKPLYTRRNATSVHELSAIGHAHIDTAWLWPLGETHRKCERTFSTQTGYMEEYPNFKFSCSQAYQYEVIQERNPDLYKRIQQRVKTGQFVPVGGTWIEPDCNIPSGEALARQFLFGQRFFQKEFGLTCKEFWNPDVFGYNGQLPQIMRLSGITRFLTQKLSWNRFNKPHHHTFTWQGIDGSEVLAHFPPADTYNAIAEVHQLRENARQYKDHDRSHHSLMLFGYGDGGGGPTKQMLEILKRAEDLQGLPRTQIRSSDEFFELLEADYQDRVTLIGELYFEYHRGTYTTQAATKRDNRKTEFLLHDIEFLATVNHALNGVPYPTEELNRLWKLVLLNQFHDILPGSSITLVYEDTARQYEDVKSSGDRLRIQGLLALQGGVPAQEIGSAGTLPGVRQAEDVNELVKKTMPATGPAAIAPINTTGFERQEVVALPDSSLAFATAPSYGIGTLGAANDSVKVEQSKSGVVLENTHLRAQLGTDGNLVSLIEKSSGREAMSAPGNRMEMYDDHPTAFDAWDVDPFHLETRRDLPDATSCEVTRQDPLRAEVTFQRTISEASTMRQVVRLDAGARRLEFHTEVDWHESHKMLKVAFPVLVRSMNATYEMQFGCVERPTHFNTPYDLARYEVPGHKWADLSEPGFGVALLTESKYGFSTYGDTMRISLLRSPKEPDPQADMGRHDFAYAILPHSGGWREAGVVAEGYRFNVPLLLTSAGAASRSFASVDDPNLVLDTIKKAEDSDAIMVRLYEAHGARGTARLKVDLPFKHATYCNILEEDGESATVTEGVVEVPYTPFQIISLKLS